MASEAAEVETHKREREEEEEEQTEQEPKRLKDLENNDASGEADGSHNTDGAPEGQENGKHQEGQEEAKNEGGDGSQQPEAQFENGSANPSGLLQTPAVSFIHFPQLSFLPGRTGNC